MVTIDPMKALITSYLATPQGQEMIHEYLSSAEGRRGICEFVATRRGRSTMKQVLPDILSCLEIPPDLRLEVLRRLKEIP